MQIINDMPEQRPVAGSFASSRYADFNNSLGVLMESMQSRNLNAFTNIADILSERSLKGMYKEALLENYTNAAASATNEFVVRNHEANVQKLEQLFENTANELIAESSLGQLNPVVGLTMPMLVRHWITCRMKNVIPTEIAPSPVWTVGIEKPYVLDMTGKKHYYPECLDELDTLMGKVKKPLSTAAINLPASAVDLITLAGGTKPLDTVSIDFYISAVTMTILDPARTGANPTATIDREFDGLRIKIKDRANNLFNERIEKTVARTGSGFEGQTDTTTDILMGNIDFETGELTLTSIAGKIKSVKVAGHLSTENHTRTLATGWDKETHQFQIPESIPMSTPLTRDRLRDAKTLYNVDEVAKAIDDMGTFLNHVRDNEILKFLDNSYLEMPVKLFKQFDVKTSADKDFNPQQHRDYFLREKLSKLAAKMKKVLKIDDVYFSVVGNPMAVRLLSNVQWAYTTDQSVGGIKLDYGFGLLEGDVHKFVVTSSERIDDDVIRIYLNPISNNHFIYKHFQYGTIIENTYRNGMNSLVPAVSVLDRYTTEELMPVQSRLEVLNEDYI